MLEISLLGPLQIHLNGTPVDNLSTSKTQALLGYLAVEHAHAHRREKLAGLLWPNYAESSARVNLRQTLKRLRQLVPAANISATRREIGLNRNADYTLDIATFTERLTRYRKQGDIDNLKVAVQLYRGDLLEQLWLDDCADFEEWLLLKREWLRRKMLEALYELTSYACNNDQFTDAMRYARRQIELDALSELAHHQLIEALAMSGRRTEALQQFVRYRELLEEELASAPSSAMVALVEQIRAGDLAEVNSQSHSSAPDESSLAFVPRPTNIPSSSTPIFGRAQEIADVVTLLKSGPSRLITIVGPGGIGKTRLAMAVAAQMVEEIFFIPLQSVSSVDAIPPVIANTINFHFTGSDSPQEQLRSYLHHKEMLLLLDNFEHLLDGVNLLMDLLSACPHIRFLVTSRERLNLQQEQVYTIDGLAYPKNDGGADKPYPAIDLFVETAHRVRYDFVVTEAEQVQIRSLCQHVEGMPLAIELAASWANVLPLTEITRSVAESLDALSSSARDLPDRHRNMHAVFDLTWQGMTETEQELFARLSIFRGGFTRTAAEEIAGVSMQQLALLVNKSLVRYDSKADRYSLHELLRQYGQEKLDAHDDESSAVRERHSGYFCTWLANETKRLETFSQPAAESPYATEFDNIVQAWEWAIDHKRAMRLQNTVNGFGLLLMRMSRYHEGASRFEVAERRWSDCPANGIDCALHRYVSAWLLIWYGEFVHFLGENNRAHALINRSLKILGTLKETAVDTRSARARALYCLGDTVTSDESRYCYEQTLAIAQAIGDRWLEASALQSLSDHLLRESLGPLDEAHAKAEASLNIHREIGDAWGISWNLQHISSIAAHRGEIAAGQRAAKESLQIRKRLGIKSNVARCYSLYGFLSILAGEFDESIEHYRQSLAIWQDLNLPVAAVHSTCDLALSLTFAGQYAAALQLETTTHENFQEESSLHFPMGRIHYYVGLIELVEGNYADALQHIQFYLEEPPQAFQRAYVLSSLALAARGLGMATDAQKKLRDALQVVSQSPRYFATLHVLNVAVLLLADAGDVDYAQELFDTLCHQPFNAQSPWFADVIGAPFAELVQEVSSRQQPTIKGQTSEWLHSTRESCQSLAEMLKISWE